MNNINDPFQNEHVYNVCIVRVKRNCVKLSFLYKKNQLIETLF